MIHEKVELFGKKLSGHLANDGIAEMRKTFLAMATDTICGHAFETSLDWLKDENATLEWQKTMRATAILIPLQKQFMWMVPIALKLPLWVLRTTVPDIARLVTFRRVGRVIHPGSGTTIAEVGASKSRSAWECAAATVAEGSKGEI
jgi:hypothetical protein